MWDKLKEILPGVLVTLAISLVSASFVFYGNFSTLNSQVQSNTQELKDTVKRSEFNAIMDGQKAMVNHVDKRLDRFEDKIDKINERLK